MPSMSGVPPAVTANTPKPSSSSTIPQTRNRCATLPVPLAMAASLPENMAASTHRAALSRALSRTAAAQAGTAVGASSYDARMRASLGVVLVVLALASCVGDDDDDSATLPCDVLVSARQNALYQLTAEVAQLPADERPPVRKISVEQLEKELRED